MDQNHGSRPRPVDNRKEPSLTGSPTDVTIDNMTPSPFSDSLRRAIRESGVTYLRLEQETGVHRASISRFVAGDRSLRLDVADKLAAHLGLRVTVKKQKG
jgi:hypothetical protein